MRRSRQRWDDVFSVLLRLECVGANWASRVTQQAKLVGAGRQGKQKRRRSGSKHCCEAVAAADKTTHDVTHLGLLSADSLDHCVPTHGPLSANAHARKSTNSLGAQRVTTPSAQVGNETFDGVAAPNGGLTDRARERAGGYRFKEH